MPDSKKSKSRNDSKSSLKLLREDIEWVDSLNDPSKRFDDGNQACLQRRLYYNLQCSDCLSPNPFLFLDLANARPLKGGGVSVLREYQTITGPEDSKSQHLKPIDRRILGQIRALKTQSAGFDFSPFKFPNSGPLLQAIVETGRAHWGNEQGPRLTMGPTRTAHLEWAATGGPEIVPRLRLDPIEQDEDLDDIIVLNANPPVWVDAMRGRIGSIGAAASPDTVYEFLKKDPLSIDRASELRSLMIEGGEASAAVAAPEITVGSTVSEKPVPVLRLQSRLLSNDCAPKSSKKVEKTKVAPIARLFMRYGEIEVPAISEARIFHELRDRTLTLVERDMRFERHAAGQLAEFGLVAGRHNRIMTLGHSGENLKPAGGVNWPTWIAETVPRLQSAGWKIDVRPSFPWRIVDDHATIEMGTLPTRRIDWFDLRLGLMIDGERFDIIAPLAAAIRQGLFDPGSADFDVMLVLVVAGRPIVIEKHRLMPIVEVLRDLFLHAPGQGESYQRHDLLAAFRKFDQGAGLANVVWVGDTTIPDWAASLRELENVVEVEVPDFGTQLYPYQARGVAWLCWLRSVGLGGILADDMGLGKTVQCLAFLTIEKAAGRLTQPALVVVTASALETWRSETNESAPGLKIFVGHEKNWIKDRGKLEQFDVVLTTYATILHNEEVFLGVVWSIMLLDEATAIKNNLGKTIRALRKIEAETRFCLTGTPVENHLGELWSLADFVVPGLLGSRASFDRDWRRPIEVGKDRDRLRRLSERLKPFLLRRTRLDVQAHLPPITETVISVVMGSAQRDLYESVRLTVHGQVRQAFSEKPKRARSLFLSALLQLRQVCCHPLLVKGAAQEEGVGSAKLEKLMELVPQLVADGRRVLVFSQFTTMIRLIRRAFDQAGIEHLVLQGDTPNRGAVVDEFRAEKAPVFLISLRAGGTSLNLQSADTVILYDTWWNPAVEAQAIGRAHRNLQTRCVQVYRLVAAASVEEKMETLKSEKHQLAEALFGQMAGVPLLLNEEVADDLLGPD